MRLHQLRLSVAFLAVSTIGCSTAAAPVSLQQRCAAVPVDDLVELKHYENSLISACPPGAEEDCIYNLTMAQTYSAGTPDLNGDGLPDQLAKYLGSNYGDADIVHYLGFVQCGDGTSIKVLEGDFKSVASPESTKAAWPDLDATRECAAPGDTSSPVQRIKLVFNKETFSYEEIPEVSPSSVCPSRN
ncbi:hypothetical protein [Stenotrophomonas sp. SY1]|uniref:hypothetical protein n=1 Tax=Stenotrophomonas sp. SY1 TaxID=477235 RepID=UPI001E556DC1|nr:hypothetical protein [Stenotrophomonas sp. SY1]MCD9087034.1 hypothetical protein [Stenotrophomonas sp. SY1]